MAEKNEKNKKNKESCYVCEKFMLDASSYDLHIKSKKHLDLVDAAHNMSKFWIKVTGSPVSLMEKETIREIFEKCGKILNVIVKDKTFYIRFLHLNSVQSARNSLNTKDFKPKKLKLSVSNLNIDFLIPLEVDIYIHYPENNEADDFSNILRKAIEKVQLLQESNKSITFDKLAKSIVDSVLIFSENEAGVQRVYTDMVKMFEQWSFEIKKHDNMYVNGQINIFGSNKIGLSMSRFSDMDMYIETDNKHIDLFGETNRLIVKSNDFHQIRTIKFARVPIIKAIHTSTDIPVDISFKSKIGWFNSNLIKFYVEYDSRVKLLVALIKIWFKRHNLNDTNCFTSYSIYWLVLFYLQQLEIPLIPSVAKLFSKFPTEYCTWWKVISKFSQTIPPSENKTSLEDLFIGFFEYYHGLDFEDKVLCPLNGTLLPREVLKLSNRNNFPPDMASYSKYLTSSLNSPQDKFSKYLSEPFKLTSLLCVQDPYDLSHNITKAVKGDSISLLMHHFKVILQLYKKNPKNILTTLFQDVHEERDELISQHRQNKHNNFVRELLNSLKKKDLDKLNESNKENMNDLSNKNQPQPPSDDCSRDEPTIIYIRRNELYSKKANKNAREKKSVDSKSIDVLMKSKTDSVEKSNLEMLHDKIKKIVNENLVVENSQVNNSLVNHNKQENNLKVISEPRFELDNMLNNVKTDTDNKMKDINNTLNDTEPSDPLDIINYIINHEAPLYNTMKDPAESNLNFFYSTEGESAPPGSDNNLLVKNDILPNKLVKRLNIESKSDNISSSPNMVPNEEGKTTSNYNYIFYNNFNNNFCAQPQGALNVPTVSTPQNAQENSATVPENIPHQIPSHMSGFQMPKVNTIISIPQNQENISTNPENVLHSVPLHMPGFQIPNVDLSLCNLIPQPTLTPCIGYNMPMVTPAQQPNTTHTIFQTQSMVNISQQIHATQDASRNLHSVQITSNPPAPPLFSTSDKMFSIFNKALNTVPSYSGASFNATVPYLGTSPQTAQSDSAHLNSSPNAVNETLKLLAMTSPNNKLPIGKTTDVSDIENDLLKDIKEKESRHAHLDITSRLKALMQDRRGSDNTSNDIKPIFSNIIDVSQLEMNLLKMNETPPSKNIEVQEATIIGLEMKLPRPGITESDLSEQKAKGNNVSPTRGNDSLTSIDRNRNQRDPTVNYKSKEEKRDVIAPQMSKNRIVVSSRMNINEVSEKIEKNLSHSQSERSTNNLPKDFGKANQSFGPVKHPKINNLLDNTTNNDRKVYQPSQNVRPVQSSSYFGKPTNIPPTHFKKTNNSSHNDGSEKHSSSTNNPPHKTHFTNQSYQNRKVDNNRSQCSTSKPHVPPQMNKINTSEVQINKNHPLQHKKYGNNHKTPQRKYEHYQIPPRMSRTFSSKQGRTSQTEGGDTEKN